MLAAFAGGWEPWARADDAIERLIPADDLPEPLRTVALDGGWDIAGASAIRTEGRVVAALPRIGRSVDGNATLAVRTNVMSRIRGLLEVTTLLDGRWRERDRLVAAANTDLLTGLASRVGSSAGAEGADGVEIADRAMLMAKRQGRGRLVTA